MQRWCKSPRFHSANQFHVPITFSSNEWMPWSLKVPPEAKIDQKWWNMLEALWIEAHVLTDGLAGAEGRMIGIIGLHHKSAREGDFPLDLLEKGMKVKIEETCHPRWLIEGLALKHIVSIVFFSTQQYLHSNPLNICTVLWPCFDWHVRCLLITVLSWHRYFVSKTAFQHQCGGQCKEASATQKIDKVRILNSVAFPRLGTCDFEDVQSYPAGDPSFQLVDEALASHFALASWYGLSVWHVLSPPVRRGLLNFVSFRRFLAAADLKCSCPEFSWCLLDDSCKLPCEKDSQKECEKKCQADCQKECQNICQGDCQKECLSLCQIECQSFCQIECLCTCPEYVSERCRSLCQTEWQSHIIFRTECQNLRQIASIYCMSERMKMSYYISDQLSEFMSDRMAEGMSDSTPEFMSDRNGHNLFQVGCQSLCHVEPPKIERNIRRYAR